MVNIIKFINIIEKRGLASSIKDIILTIIIIVWIEPASFIKANLLNSINIIEQQELALFIKAYILLQTFKTTIKILVLKLYIIIINLLEIFVNFNYHKLFINYNLT